MANSKEFSHITVTADDDDVVIQAGAVEEAALEETADDDGGAIDEVVEEGVEEAADDEPVPAPDDADAAPTGAPRPAEGGYRETTLEDLEGAKMSTTQKVIIIVAVLGVIAFAAWYLLAH